MSKSAWGNIGNWAAESERAEAEEREAAEKSSAAAQPPPLSYPSLKESVTSSTKQKKKTKMTLQQFTMQSTSTNRGLTTEEMLRLPTGPKERSPDEMHHGGRLGGGFSNYGSNQSRGGRDYGGAGGEGRRSYGFDDDNNNNNSNRSRVSDIDRQPSRSDGVDNWASMKRQQQPQTLIERNQDQGRVASKYGALGGGGGPGVASRADEVDNWASVKKPVAISQQPHHHQQESSRYSGFGSGFARPDPDRWTRNDPPPRSDPPPKFEVEVVAKTNKPNPFGAARPREEVLAEKGLDWKKLDLESDVEKKQHSVSGGSRPTSSSSRPGTAHSSRSEVEAAAGGEGVVKQKPKVNPFGDAKPREVLLEEKGMDWKKIDFELEHRRVERPETEEEKNMKEEIEHLKNELLQKSGDEQTSMQDLINKREQELELLVRELDDKVRYSQKFLDRQGSGIGRAADRPPSRPGAYDEPRASFHDRPPSRGGEYKEPRPGSHDRPPSRGAYGEPRAGYDERPRSRPGAYEDPRLNYQERPRSRPGAYEEPRSGFPQRSFMPGGYQEPRSFDHNERPHSHGTGNSWNRPGEDRRGIQGGGGRGFFGSRDDRSGSRW